MRRQGNPGKRTGGWALDVTLDEKDHSILNLLRTDSRMPIRDIAKKTGIRPSTVHQRIQRLRTSGVIEKFTIKVNNKAFGENFIVFMLVTTEGELTKAFTEDHRLKEMFGITGEYDLLLKFKFKDVNEFNEYIISARKQAEIKKTLTMVVTTTVKEEL